MSQLINDLTTVLNDVGQGFCNHAAGIFIQSSILILLLLAVNFLLGKRVRAVFRYCLWMLVFVKLVLPSSLALPSGIGYWLGDYWPSEPVVSAQVAAVEAGPPLAVAPTVEAEAEAFELGPIAPVAPAASVEISPAQVRPEPISWQGLVLLGWLVGVLIFSALLVQRARFVKGLLDQAEKANGRLLDLLDRCRADVGVTRQVGLRISASMVSPAVCGLFRHTILLPGYLLGNLDRQKVRAVLIHELAHVKRCDTWVNLVQTVLQIVYFYNPLLWLANAMVRRVREQAVDEMVLVTLGREADGYSDTLVDIAELAFWRPALSLRLIGVVESKKALTQRIKHIVSRPLPKTAKLGLLGLIAVFISAAVLLPMACGRAEDTPSGVNNDSSGQMPSGLSEQEVLGMPAEKAVVIDPYLLWRSTNWGGQVDTPLVAMEEEKDRPRFIVAQAGMRHVWIYYFSVPFDAQRYPIAVLTYRARNTDPEGGAYGLWIDDSTGPNQENIFPFRSFDFLPDGEIHEVRTDLRELEPKGEIIALGLGVNCGKQPPAEFELIGLRFEADADSGQVGPIREDSQVSIRVVDQAGEPVEGARVTVDSERINWSRSALTDKDGRASVTPLANDFARHMLRISKPGMATVELGHYRSKVPLPGQITLKEAVRYGGVVQNEDGELIAGAAMNILIPQLGRYVNVFTDSEGRWQTPPLPDDLKNLMVRVTHPDYIRQPNYRQVGAVMVDELRQGTGVMTLRSGIAVDGIVVDKEGNPVADAQVRQGDRAWGQGYPVAYTDKEGRFHFPSTEPGKMILTVQKKDFAPEMIRLEAQQDMDPVRFVLEKGQPILGRVVDERGEPIKDVLVHTISWDQASSIWFEAVTDSEGRFAWQNAPPNEVLFGAGKRGYVRSSFNLAPSDTEQVITMPHRLEVLRPLRSISSFIAGVARPKPGK